MKNFLKSTVVFACVALMFCACSEDDTEVSGNLGSAEITSLTPGDGRALLEWTVPEDNITASTISWSSSNGTSGSVNTAVNSTEVNKYQISNIPAGTYTITVKNIGGSDSSDEVSSTVDVYTSETYTNSTPVIQSMTFSDSTTAEIVWLPYSDCTYVQLTYADSEDATNTITTEKHSVDETMTLTGVTSGDPYTIRSFFQPADGADEVYVVSTSVFDAAPPAPSNVVIAPGDKKVRVTWEMSSSDLRYVGSTKVEYSGPSEGIFVYEDLVYGENECWVDGLSSGDYTIRVYNAKTETATPSVVTEEVVTVYEASSYGVYYLDVANITYYTLTTSNRPGMPASTTGYLTDDPFVGVEIEWTKAHDDCVGVSLSYIPYGETEAVESDYFSLDVPTILTDAQRGTGENSAFSFTSYFCPEGGAENVSLDAQKGVNYYFCEDAPTDLAAVLAYPGVTYSYVTDPVTGSDVYTSNCYVVLNWAVADETNLYAVTITYTEVDDTLLSPHTGTVEVLYPTTTTTINGLNAGSEYDFEIVTSRISGTSSNPTLISVQAYDSDTYKDSLPSPEAYYTDGTGADGTVDDTVKIYWKGTIDSALQSVTVSYNDTEEVYSVVNGMIPTSIYTVDLAAAGYSYSWSATFLPDNALDEVTIEGGDATITELSVPADIQYNSEGGYYEIYTGWGLAVFADLVNGTNYATTRAATEVYTLSASSLNGLTLGGSSQPSLNAKVMYDLDLSGFCYDADNDSSTTNTKNWSPIGANYDQFSVTDGVYATLGVSYAGEFDGANCSISNLYISNNTATGGAYIGLFGQTNGATIKDVILHNPDVRCYNNTGGLIGVATSSTISGCGTTIDSSLHVEITGITDEDGNASTAFSTATNYRIRSLTRGESVAGLIGQAIGCTVTNCYNTVNAGSVAGSQCRPAAGVVATTSTGTTITNCWNSGAVRANSYNVGGIVGNNASGCTVSNCYNTGFISGGGIRAGGIAGTNLGNIYGCYNSGDIYSTTSQVGGIAGYCGADSNVSASYSTGDVTTSGAGSETVYIVVGGVVGQSDGAVISCYTTGLVSATATDQTYVTAGGVAGGAAGADYFTGCYYTEDVDDMYGVGCIISATVTSGGTATVTYGSAISSASDGAALATIEELNSSALAAMNALLTDWTYVPSTDTETTGPSVSAVN